MHRCRVTNFNQLLSSSKCSIPTQPPVYHGSRLSPHYDLLTHHDFNITLVNNHQKSLTHTSRDIASLRPVISQHHRYHYPYKATHVEEVIQVRPHTALPIPTTNKAEQVHEYDEEECKPAQDGSVYSIEKRRKDRKHGLIIIELLAIPNQ